MKPFYVSYDSGRPDNRHRPSWRDSVCRIADYGAYTVLVSQGAVGPLPFAILISGLADGYP